jgi:hypothetical protein
MTPSRLLFAALLLVAAPGYALDVAPGSTSPSLQAQGCATASGGLLGDCLDGCFAQCTLSENTAEAALDISNYTLGKKFVESTAYTDFTVTTGQNGAANGVDATVSYDVQWAGGWTLAGVFTGFNDVQSTVTLTLFDQTMGGTVVRSATVHSQKPDGFIGIDIIDVGFGLDQGSSVNSMSSRLIRGHSYRLGLKVRVDGKGAANAQVIVDYLAGNWGVWWNDLKVSIAPDLVVEIEKLKKRVDALEDHTHTYLTGRGEGHNNPEAETSKPILIVEEPTDDERRLLPAEEADVVPLPVKSVFLQNAPNPFNPTTTITYQLPAPLFVTITLYDAQGRRARTLVSAERAAGPHAFAFDGADLASGVYYYRLTAGRFSETRKLTLLK